jgi:hypothetical protein
MVFDAGIFTTYSFVATLYDATTPVIVASPVLERAFSVQCGIDASKDATDYARWMWGISPTLLNTFKNDWLYVQAYFETLAYINACAGALRFYLMDTAVKGMAFYFTKSALSVGWNLLKCDLDNPTSKDSGFDFSKIHQFWFFINETVGNTNDFNVYLESAIIARPLHD